VKSVRWLLLCSEYKSSVLSGYLPQFRSIEGKKNRVMKAWIDGCSYFWLAPERLYNGLNMRVESARSGLMIYKYAALP
jgi:hypothetical protein